MDKARYIDKEGNTSFVYAKDITPKQYETMYKGKLFCEYEDCKAELVHHERQKGGFLRYFTTRPESNHKRDCDNELFHGGSKASKISILGETVNVSEKHVSKALTDGYKKFYEQLHPSEVPITPNKPKRKKRVPKSRGEGTEVEGVGIPVASGGTIAVEGVKEPYIYKREVSELKKEDKDSFKEIHSLVDDIRIEEDKAYIDVTGLDGSKCSIYIGTPFRTSCEQEFKLLGTIEKYIKQLKLEDKEIIINCFGEYLANSNEAIIQIYDYKHFKLNNNPFYQIIRMFNN